MKWFGVTWGAPINDDCEHAATPVGEPCSKCPEPIGLHDRGVIIPAFIAPEREPGAPATGLVSAWSHRPMHLRCFMEEVLGPSWRVILGSHIDELIDRSSIGSAAWVDCEQHGRQPTDPFKGGCLACVSEAERSSRAAYYADDDEDQEQWGRL